MMIDGVEQLIRRKPGSTASELAKALFGNDGYHERVSGYCLSLYRLSRVKRSGGGGPGDPFTYFPAAGRRPRGIEEEQAPSFNREH